MSLFDHPGNLESTRDAVLAIHHYDWPAYPKGNDFRETLFYFTGFPRGTKFVEVDDGDRSILFAADVSSARLNDLYHHRNFHICAWHEDLIEMHNRGFITGVELVTENTHRYEGWKKTLNEIGIDKLFYEVDDESQEITGPIREVDNGDEIGDWVLLNNNFIRVTQSGLDFIINELTAQNIDYSVTLSPVVSKLMTGGFYDTAVREACVTLEHSIKSKLQCNKWGERLTDEFFEYLRNENDILESSLRTYSQELRTVFKLVRNVFMHNINEIDYVTATMLLFRISRVKSAIEE